VLPYGVTNAQDESTIPIDRKEKPGAIQTHYFSCGQEHNNQTGDDWSRLGSIQSLEGNSGRASQLDQTSLLTAVACEPLLLFLSHSFQFMVYKSSLLLCRTFVLGTEE
jgi:hypothetical protein